MTEVQLPVRVMEPRRGIADLGLSELRHHGDLLWLLMVRELKLRYAQTLLGPVWVIVNPLVPALLFTFLFTKVTTIDTGGIPYLVLVTTAMVPWNTVSRALTKGGGSLVAERNLLTKVYFPRLLVPLAITLTCVVDHLVSIAIVGVAMLQSGTHLTWRVVVLPALLVWALALALAVTLLVAAFSVRRRDALSALPIAVQVWLYASPVAYPLGKLSPAVRHLLALNPMTSLVEAHRWAITGRSGISGTAMAGGIAAAAVLLVVALSTFRTAERKMADVL